MRGGIGLKSVRRNLVASFLASAMLLAQTEHKKARGAIDQSGVLGGNVVSVHCSLLCFVRSTIEV